LGSFLVVVVPGVCWQEKTDDEPSRLVVIVCGCVCWQERTDDEPTWLAVVVGVCRGVLDAF
jgi:hypothetical protein